MRGRPRVGKVVRLSAKAYTKREKVRKAIVSNKDISIKDRHAMMRAYDKTNRIGRGKKIGKNTKVKFY